MYAHMVQIIKLEGTYPKAEKNQLELMKIFSVLGLKFTDTVISYLQKHIEDRDSISQVAVLRTFKFIIPELIRELESYRESIVSSMNFIQDTKYRCSFRDSMPY